MRWCLKLMCPKNDCNDRCALLTAKGEWRPRAEANAEGYPLHYLLREPMPWFWAWSRAGLGWAHKFPAVATAAIKEPWGSPRADIEAKRGGGNAKHFNNESKSKIPKKKKKQRIHIKKWRKNLSKAAKHTHLDTDSECVWHAVSHFMLTTFSARSAFHQEATNDEPVRLLCLYHHFVYH